ncbi:unnamed protein product [Amoebophrya sp. A25]|nr:unnamed protein product [Amoebophrya sp. A25]|eukprot:GSA25T00023279001.1
MLFGFEEASASSSFSSSSIEGRRRRGHRSTTRSGRRIAFAALVSTATAWLDGTSILGVNGAARPQTLRRDDTALSSVASSSTTSSSSSSGGRTAESDSERKGLTSVITSSALFQKNSTAALAFNDMMHHLLGGRTGATSSATSRGGLLGLGLFEIGTSSTSTADNKTNSFLITSASPHHSTGTESLQHLLKMPRHLPHGLFSRASGVAMRMAAILQKGRQYKNKANRSGSQKSGQKNSLQKGQQSSLHSSKSSRTNTKTLPETIEEAVEEADAELHTATNTDWDKVIVASDAAQWYVGRLPALIDDLEASTEWLELKKDLTSDGVDTGDFPSRWNTLVTEKLQLTQGKKVIKDWVAMLRDSEATQKGTEDYFNQMLALPVDDLPEEERPLIEGLMSLKPAIPHFVAIIRRGEEYFYAGTILPLLEAVEKFPLNRVAEAARAVAKVEDKFSSLQENRVELSSPCPFADIHDGITERVADTMYSKPKSEEKWQFAVMRNMNIWFDPSVGVLGQMLKAREGEPYVDAFGSASEALQAWSKEEGDLEALMAEVDHTDAHAIAKEIVKIITALAKNYHTLVKHILGEDGAKILEKLVTALGKVIDGSPVLAEALLNDYCRYGEHVIDEDGEYHLPPISKDCVHNQFVLARFLVSEPIASFLSFLVKELFLSTLGVVDYGVELSRIATYKYAQAAAEIHKDVKATPSKSVTVSETKAMESDALFAMEQMEALSLGAYQDVLEIGIGLAKDDLPKSVAFLATSHVEVDASSQSQSHQQEEKVDALPSSVARNSGSSRLLREDKHVVVSHSGGLAEEEHKKLSRVSRDAVADQIAKFQSGSVQTEFSNALSTLRVAPEEGSYIPKSIDVPDPEKEIQVIVPSEETTDKITGLSPMIIVLICVGALIIVGGGLIAVVMLGGKKLPAEGPDAADAADADADADDWDGTPEGEAAAPVPQEQQPLVTGEEPVAEQVPVVEGEPTAVEM